jgi:hypothetical protein
MPFFVFESNGPQGLPGLSAFQVAQANGFSGTELEWLASLQGPPGNAGMFELVVPTPSDTWIATHNLGFRPNVNVVDPDGEVVYCNVTHVNTNLAVLTFAQPFSGTATFS